MLKYGKRPEFASSYRLVCLLNTISKLLEIPVRERLLGELKMKDGLYEVQYDFKRV